MKDGKYGFTFPESQLKQAHDTMSGKFIHGDDIQRNTAHAQEAIHSEEGMVRKNVP